MSDTCKQCGHPDGDHLLTPTVTAWVQVEGGRTEIPAGGHTYCPVAGCDCHGTWSIQDGVAGFDVMERVAAKGEPDRETIHRIRGH